MKIEEVREKVERGEYEISFHAEKERYAEDILIADLEAAVLSAEKYWSPIPMTREGKAA